uniref:ATP-dependent DNA helicase n=1 Tax=Tanacetum cinerariifolium TaxID=118510 RepID=A0A6L2KUA7_TANCI|nr:DNA helicase [Tanacetum cinerariifolium]
MKTKRKLVPKSTPVVGDPTIVRSAIVDRVPNVQLNASTKRQRLCGSNSVSSVAVGVGPFGVHSVAPVDVNALSYAGTSRSLLMLQTNVIFLTTGTSQPGLMLEGCQAVPVIGIEPQIAPASLQTQRMASNVNSHSRARRDRTRHNSATAVNYSNQGLGGSGSTSEYKHIGNCVHTCQHCGALFWFEQRLKNTPNGVRPSYNRCCRAGRVALRTYQIYLVQLFRTAQEKFEDTHIPDFKIRLYNVVGAQEYEIPTGYMLGGPRYMYSHYLNALAICRVHGNPSYFIMFTCNVKWFEIADYMLQFSLLTTTDRADVVDRVFELKIHQFVNYLRDTRPFGKVVAELPLQDEDPEGYIVVSELMMHGPCGLANPSGVCTQNSSRCKKDFPKEYCDQTYVDKSSFVHYKRRDTGATMTRQSGTDQVVARISRNTATPMGTTATASTSRSQKTIFYTLRCEGKIVLAVASSDIASLLLSAGGTAHSRFKILLDLTDTSVCAIKKNTQMVDLLKETCLIV